MSKVVPQLRLAAFDLHVRGPETINAKNTNIVDYIGMLSLATNRKKLIKLEL